MKAPFIISLLASLAACDNGPNTQDLSRSEEHINRFHEMEAPVTVKKVETIGSRPDYIFKDATGKLFYFDLGSDFLQTITDDYDLAAGEVVLDEGESIDAISYIAKKDTTIQFKETKINPLESKE